jgi:DNA processing protein
VGRADPLDADALARLRLIRTSSVGPVTYRHLLARFGTAQAAIDAIPDLARRGSGRLPHIPSLADIVREAESVAALGGYYLLGGRDDYPSLLAEADDAPPALIAIGNAALLARPSVALVGARNASAAAVRFARQLAFDLAALDYVVVSGLARGVDTAAHQGALDGGTIGVVAGGIDIFYPPENEALQRSMARRGLVLSEQPPGTEPHARHFPSRNRIIAGLSQGTVVVEAAPRSGSLITARLAADYGREVMAVPGSPLDPRAQGCNLLIREGATLIQSAADIAEALRPFGRFLHCGPGRHGGDRARAAKAARFAEPQPRLGGRAGPPVRPVSFDRPHRAARARTGRPAHPPCGRAGQSPLKRGDMD